MTDAHTALAPAPQLAPRTPTERSRITGRLKVALDSMVFEGMAWDEAAKQAGLTVRSMRLALERSYTLTYLRAQKQVFRESVSAANISRLAEIRDTSGNAMAQLGAIKTLEQISDEPQASGNAGRTAGVVIVINAPAGANVSAAHMPHIRATDDKALK